MRGHAEEFVFGGVGLAELIDEQGLLLDEQPVLQVGADAGDRLFGADRLGQVIDSTSAQALDDIVGFTFGGDEDDRGGFFAVALAELAAGLESVDAWHHDIEQDDVRIIAISGGRRTITPQFNLDSAALIGVRQTLTKPFNREQLLQAIQNALE